MKQYGVDGGEACMRSMKSMWCRERRVARRKWVGWVLKGDDMHGG